MYYYGMYYYLWPMCRMTVACNRRCRACRVRSPECSTVLGMTARLPELVEHTGYDGLDAVQVLAHCRPLAQVESASECIH